MQLKFNTTVDDYRIFSAYIYRNSVTLRKNRIRQLVILFLILMGAYFILVRDKNLYVALVVAVTALMYLFLADIWRRRAYIKNAVRMYLEREEGQESRSSTLTLTEKGIRAVSRDAEAEFKWEGINRIVESHDRTYIFVTPVDAILIPRERIEEGDYTTFITAVKDRHRQTN